MEAVASVVLVLVLVLSSASVTEAVVDPVADEGSVDPVPVVLDGDESASPSPQAANMPWLIAIAMTRRFGKRMIA